MSETTVTKPLSYHIFIITKVFKNSLKSCNSYITVQFLLMYFTVLITHFSAYLSICMVNVSVYVHTRAHVLRNRETMPMPFHINASIPWPLTTIGVKIA